MAGEAATATALDVGKRFLKCRDVATALTDQELIAQVAGGDRRAFTGIVERHKDAVYALAYRLLGSTDEAAEVVQETFLNAYSHLRDFRNDAPVGAWLKKIAANECFMRLRRRRIAGDPPTQTAEPEFSDRGSLVEAMADWGKSAEAEALDHELQAAIESAAAALSDEHRQVFILKDVEGLSYEAIADVVGESVAAVKSRLHRSRLIMRAAIDRYYQQKE